jgi:hypothetical protein
MEALTTPETPEQDSELYPNPPEGRDFAVLHRHLVTLKPLLGGWAFQPDKTEGARPSVGFVFGNGFTGQIALEETTYIAEVYAGVCPMDADALRMMLRHKAWWRWMTRGVIAGEQVKIFLNVRQFRSEGLEDLTGVIVSGIEMAYKQRAELDIWWSRTMWAQEQTQA